MSPVYTKRASGDILAQADSSANFTMTTDATVEDVPTMACTFTYDGRPVQFGLTPVYTATDDVGQKLCTLTIVRSTDNAIQRTSTRLALASTDQIEQSILTGALTAWPSDSAAFVVGTAYTIKLRILCGASAKASVFGASTPYTLFVRAA